RISLLTLHASKGLEFPVVFIIGCEDGLLPLRFPGEDDEEQVREERRLLFVGMTRAQRHLYLSHATQRQGTTSAVSPFLADVPADVRHSVKEAIRRKKPQSTQLSLL